MSSKSIIAFIVILISVGTLSAQQPSDDSYLAKINMELPHKFGELKVGATLEAVRDHGVVRFYILVDDIEQYGEIVIERRGELGHDFALCKTVKVQKGKFKNNYLELVDQYPLPSKTASQYRIKAMTDDGIMRIFPPVSIQPGDAAAVSETVMK